MDGQAQSPAAHDPQADTDALQQWAALVRTRASAVLIRTSEPENLLPARLLDAMRRHETPAETVDQQTVERWISGEEVPQSPRQLLAYQNAVGMKGEGISKANLTAAQVTQAVNLTLQTPPALNERLVRHWLHGTCVPETPELHAQLLDVLGLTAPKVNGHAGTASTPVKDPRFAFNMLYAQIDPHYRTDQPEALVSTLPETRRSLCIGHAHAMGNEPRTAHVTHRRAGNYYDHPAIPKRKTTGGTVYQELAKSELRTLVGTGPEATENPHEFLSAFMALDEDLTDMSVQDKTGHESIYGIRHGKFLPSAQYLQALKPLMDGYDPNYYPRFEALVTLARLRIASYKQGAIDRGEIDLRTNPAANISNSLHEIPQSYWRDLLHITNHPGTDSATLASPAWLLSVSPIVTQKDYMRAVRYAFGKKVQEVAHAIGLVNGDVVFNSEHDRQHAGAGDHLNEIIAHYKQLDAERTADLAAKSEPAESLFDEAVYHALPPCRENAVAPKKYVAAMTSRRRHTATYPAAQAGASLG